MLAAATGTHSVKAPFSGFIPVYISLLALGVVTVSLMINGVTPQHDEDAFAHIYQILIILDVPFIGFFVLRWIRTRFWMCVRIFVIQAIVLATALLPVWLLHL